MNPRLANLLTRLYPRAWRERYGAEFEEFLQTGNRGVRASTCNVWVARRRAGKIDYGSNSGHSAVSFIVAYR